MKPTIKAMKISIAFQFLKNHPWYIGDKEFYTYSKYVTPFLQNNFVKNYGDKDFHRTLSPPKISMSTQLTP